MVTRVELPQLTGLRFLAAGSVVLFHLQFYSLSGVPGPVLRVAAYGNASVGLFFILSGFILTYTYLGSSGRLDKRRFWFSRFARIYPVYLLALLIAAPVDIRSELSRQSAHALPELLASLLSTPFLLQAWIPQVALSWDAPSWSLSAEAFFYALFPFVAPRLMRLSVRRASLVFVGLWVAALTGPFVYDFIFPNRVSAAGPTGDPWLLFVGYNPLARLPEFVLGIIVARLFLARPRDARPALNGILSGVVLAALLGLCLTVPNLPFLVVNNGLFDPLFALLVYGLATESGLIARVFSTRAIVFLGGASYALYLLHWPAIEMLSRTVHLAGMSQLVLLFGFAVSVIIAAAVTFRIVEQPARAALRTRFERMQPQRASPVPARKYSSPS
jgi:peptidoglycan/LPS O-acetylase OafA/YrhL